jgi:uncharacterized protein
MSKRWSALAAVLVVTTVMVSLAGASHLKEQPKKHRVVYHLSDPDKTRFVLGNIENHIAGEGGNVLIVLVVHGPALAMFQTARTNPDVTRRTAGIAKAGVNLAACGNTMDAQKISVADLLPGFVRVEEGGVVRLARLQAEGYAYLRP